LGLLVWVLRLRRANIMWQEEVEKLGKELEHAIQRLAQYESESRSKTFTNMVDLLAAAGIPGLVLLAAMGDIRLYRGCGNHCGAFVSRGPSWDGWRNRCTCDPWRSYRQVRSTDVSVAVVRRLLNTRSKTTLIQEIEALPRVVPQKFRVKAKSMLESV